MASAVVLLLSLCVFTVEGQVFLETFKEVLLEVYDAAYDYEITEIPVEEFTDTDYDWLYDYIDYECDPNPCLNDGLCDTHPNGSFVCSCPEPYTGKTCQKLKNVCKDAKCGRGNCLVTSTAPFFECKCKAPYRPPKCMRSSACRPSPCLNGGTCTKGSSRASFQCACPNGYSGKYCQVGPNDCYKMNGEDYRGMVSETEEGEECLHWNDYFIVEQAADPFKEYPDFKGFGPHNNCRNPDGDDQPWCFIKNQGKLEWDHCKVRSCSGSAQPTTKPSITQPTPAAQFSECGKPEPTRTARIFGGGKTCPGAHPWQVSLQRRPNGTDVPYYHVCGGILIKPCWVLTAGHCIKSQVDMRVVLGGVNLDKDEEYDQTIEVEKAIVHEDYRDEPQAVYNDIALLKLKAVGGQCAKESRYVKTACLPNQRFPDGTQCVISGWGATEKDKSGSNLLLDAHVLLISQERCKAKEVYKNLLDNSMFCAGIMKGGVDSCKGDSGGPLVCEQNGTHFVSGVVSWGHGCAVKNKPGVYANVHLFIDWIASKIQS